MSGALSSIHVPSFPPSTMYGDFCRSRMNWKWALPLLLFDRFEPTAPALQYSDFILKMGLFPSIRLPQDLNANHTRH